MSYTKKYSFNDEVVNRIKVYMYDNNKSINKVSFDAGMTYQQLYQILHKNQLMKLREYVLICQALNVPLDTFVEGLDASL